MIRKIVAALLCAAFIFSLASCNGNGGDAQTVGTVKTALEKTDAMTTVKADADDIYGSEDYYGIDVTVYKFKGMTFDVPSVCTVDDTGEDRFVIYNPDYPDAEGWMILTAGEPSSSLTYTESYMEEYLKSTVDGFKEIIYYENSPWRGVESVWAGYTISDGLSERIESMIIFFYSDATYFFTGYDGPNTEYGEYFFVTLESIR
ncbi:MAG: hypothetical protein IJR90_06160 [Clostridia bacterium]|nr:hypothetical protein [Clostridia bacterium]